MKFGEDPMMMMMRKRLERERERFNIKSLK
jgi:hypothetical protein